MENIDVSYFHDQPSKFIKCFLVNSISFNFKPIYFQKRLLHFGLLLLQQPTFAILIAGRFWTFLKNKIIYILNFPSSCDVAYDVSYNVFYDVFYDVLSDVFYDICYDVCPNGWRPSFKSAHLCISLTFPFPVNYVTAPSDISQIIQRYFTDMSLIFHRYVTDISWIFHRYTSFFSMYNCICMYGVYVCVYPTIK